MTILINKPVAPCLKTMAIYLEQVNASGWYTNFGPLHQKLTCRLEEYLQVKNLLLVSNGTLALQVAYKTLGLNRAICTPFSYIATASSLAWDKISTSFVDIDSNSLNLCPSLVDKKLESSSNFDSIIATHVYGNPCDVKSFDDLSSKYNIKVIYDAAHAFGVRYGEKSLLSYGDASTLSFHATKVFHTIEGGGIIFKENDNYEKAKQFINFSIDSNGMPTGAGINAKLNEYQCAVGLTLLDNIDNILDHRRTIFNEYTRLLESSFDLPIWNENTSQTNGSYFPIILKNKLEKNRIKTLLDDHNIPCREYFTPSLNIVFKPEDVCSVSESIASRILCLPLHFYLTLDDVRHISSVIRESKK
jgi:dTDP-4-amino-4,6-dideoxygalactose transaminase